MYYLVILTLLFTPDFNPDTDEGVFILGQKSVPYATLLECQAAEVAIKDVQAIYEQRTGYEVAVTIACKDNDDEVVITPRTGE